jgi:hypothetical protein
LCKLAGIDPINIALPRGNFALESVSGEVEVAHILHRERGNGNRLLEMFKKGRWSHKERAPATSPENLLAEMSRCSRAKQLPKEGIATEKLLDNCWR